jgi:hypothetical protein
LVFVGFSLIFLLWILIFKGLTARRLYKSFGVKGLISPQPILGGGVYDGLGMWQKWGRTELFTGFSAEICRKENVCKR